MDGPGTHEVDRFEWRAQADGATPYEAVQDFLSSAGFPVADLSNPRPGPAPRSRNAAILLGGGWPIRARGGAASPCPEVPDVAVVVFEPGTARPAPAGRLRVGEWTDSWSVDDHAAAVDAVRASIARGDVYQVNVVGHRSAPYDGDPAVLAQRLRAVEETPWAGSLSGAGWTVCSASPEMLLTAESGGVTTRPIKGTAARSPGRPLDDPAASALRTSAKDQAEHVMIVDLERNDLGRVCETGSIEVTELYAVRPLAGVWHAESTVTGRLAAGTGLGELLSAMFPGGSVTGAPKGAALREIARHEPVGRGPSMGALGRVTGDGRVALGLTIRTVAAAAGRLHLWAGGGITWGSDPRAEVAEAAAKAAPILAALAEE